MCDILVTKSQKEDFINKRLSTGKKEKIALVLVGGPGSGKSSGKTVTINNIGKTIKDFVNIDPDEILTNLFNNNNECYDRVSKINNKSFNMAIEQNKNIIFDGTGSNYDWYSKNVIKKLKNNDYKVILIIVKNSVDKVLSRIKKRAKLIKRNVDEPYTRSVYKHLSSNIPKYLSLTCNYADFIYLYDNSKQSINLIYKTKCVGNEKIMVNNDYKKRNYKKKTIKKQKSISKKRLTQKSKRKIKKI